MLDHPSSGGVFINERLVAAGIPESGTPDPSGDSWHWQSTAAWAWPVAARFAARGENRGEIACMWDMDIHMV